MTTDQETVMDEIMFPPDHVPTDATADATPFPELTARERAVAVMLVEGAINSEIAKTLDISQKTVDTHRAHILKKLELRNNVMLTRHAIRMGYVTL